MLTPAVSGPRPAPGLNQAIHDAWPLGCVACWRRFFSTMHLKSPLVQERSEGGCMDRGRERPNPWRNRTFLQTCPLLGEGLSGDQSQRGKRESSRKGPYRANPRGVRGNGRGQRGRSPRKPMGPGKFQPPCASLGQFLRHFLYRGQSWLPPTRNRGRGRSPASDFFGGCIGNVRKSGVEVGSQEREEGQPPTAV